MANETPCGRCGHLMEDVSVENEQAREKRHNIQPTLRRRRFRCPECGAEKTVAETATTVRLRVLGERRGGAWGKDEGPWEG